jgi:hypothetical protein
LQGAADTGLNLLNALLAVSDDAWRLEGDASTADLYPPTLFAKVGDQEADCPQFLAIAIINVSARQCPQFLGEAGWKLIFRAENGLQFFALGGRQKGSEPALPTRTK